MRKILVTGGAGYIGSVTTRALTRAGFVPIVFDNLSTGFREAVPQGVRFVFGDVRDRALLNRIAKDEKIDAAIHFAAKLIVPESVEKPLEYYDVNVLGGLNVAKTCLQQSAPLVFSSTAAVYGNPLKNPIDEAAAPDPLNPYGASKLMVEKILGDFDRGHGLRSVSLRYFNVAGATIDLSVGQRTRAATHLIKVAAEAACGKRSSVKIFGTDYATPDGTGVRDFIHVEDLADVHVLALQDLFQGGRTRVLNCGYGHGYSVREVLNMMLSLSERSFKIEEAPRRVGDAQEVVANASQVRSLFDWKPQRDDLRLICSTSLEWEKSLA